jgi:amino acid permease
LGLALTPVVLKKELKELKFVSLTLFLAIGIFLCVFIIDLSLGIADNPDVNYKQYYRTTWNVQCVTSFSIVLVAYSFQQNLFPTYNSLAIKSNKECLKVVLMGQIYSFCIYVTLGIIAVYMFGSNIQNSVLDNVNEMTTASSYIIRGAFLIVLACHIPYIFYSGKESMLIMIDEFRSKSMTQALELTLQNAVIGATVDRD